jgi:hypothetical protein
MTAKKYNLSSAPRRQKALALILAASLAAAYLVAGCLFLTPYLSNADGVSYISIAQKYARGDFSEAVNGYWSPLLSWLLVPPILLSFNPVVAAKGLILISGLALAFGIFLLGKRFGLPKGTRMFLAVLSLPIILFRYVLGQITPDLLLATILVYYFYLVFDPDYFQNKWTWPASALLGALAYFSKSYAFFFFLAHLIALGVFHVLRSPRGAARTKILLKVSGTMLVFLAVSGMWIAALSLKYQGLTISTAGRIAMSLHSPQSKGHFTKSRLLVPPPNPTAVSAWEDPSLYSSQPSWNPLGSIDKLKHFLSDLGNNCVDMVNVLIDYSLWSLVIIPLAFVLSLWPGRHRPVFLALATLLIYDAGYAIVGVNTRYLYINEVLILLMGGYVLNLAFQRMGPGRRGLKAVMALALASLFVLTPYTLSAKFPLKHPAFFRGSNGDPDKTLFLTSRSMAKALANRDPDTASGGRLRVASDGRYQDTLIFCYYAELSFCGIVSPQKGASEPERELRENGVDYLFLWEKSEIKFPFLRDCPKPIQNRPRRLRVYDVRRLRSRTTGR